MNRQTGPPHDASPDEALAIRAARGDERAFEAIDRRHRRAVHRHCLGILRDHHDADEATQRAMIRAYAALRRGQRPRSTLAWLIAIGRNEAYDVLRAGRPAHEVPADVAAPDASPEERLLLREALADLRSDLRDLPDGQRRALALRALAGMPHAEIARHLGCSEVDARTLCSEARRSLVEFEAGRNLECSSVRARIDAGDGRALRARRVRSHLRACSGCREAAGAARPRGLAGLLPLPWLALLRPLVGGGATAPAAAGGAALATAATAALLAGAIVTAPAPPLTAPPAANARASLAPATGSAPAAEPPERGEAPPHPGRARALRDRTTSDAPAPRAPGPADAASAGPAAGTPPAHAPVAPAPSGAGPPTPGRPAATTPAAVRAIVGLELVPTAATPPVVPGPVDELPAASALLDAAGRALPPPPPVPGVPPG